METNGSRKRFVLRRFYSVTMFSSGLGAKISCCFLTLIQNRNYILLANLKNIKLVLIVKGYKVTRCMPFLYSVNNCEKWLAPVYFVHVQK